MELLTGADPDAFLPSRDLTLEGEHVRLVPLEVAHAEPLQHWADAREEGLDASLASPMDFDGSVWEFFRWLIEDVPAITPFAVTSRSGAVLGYTRYLHVEPKRRMLHIGGTWYAPPYRGTVVNPEAKQLLLRYAFEEAGFNRVQIQTDVLNVRSQRAITRIGATYEGISRADYVRRDGSIRDTWVAAVIRPEWPQVRAKLDGLIAAAPTL